MRTNKHILNRIIDVLEKYDCMELVYLKTEKDDTTDVTFMSTVYDDGMRTCLRSYIHPEHIIITEMNYPCVGSYRIECFNIEN